MTAYRPAVANCHNRVNQLCNIIYCSEKSMKSAQMCWIVTIQTACDWSHIASPPQTHTLEFFIIQRSKFSSSAGSGLIYQGRDKRLTPGWTSSSTADVDHGGTTRADPLTSPPLSNPCDMNYPTLPADCWQDRVLMNYGRTCLPEPLFYYRNTYGYTSYLWFSWSKEFYIKTWN